MMFWELFKIQLKQIYRNRAGLFWTVLVPVGIYVGVSYLPLESLVGLGATYPQYLLPGIIAMVLMQGGIYTLAYAMIESRAHGVMKRLAVTPLTRAVYIASMMTARLTVMLAQVVVLTAVGALLFDVQIHFPIFTVILFSVLGGAVFLVLGLLISTFADTYESAAPITSALGLPLAFLGDIFYPIEKLPDALQAVSRVLPITHMSGALRQAYVAGTDITQLWPEAIMLTCWLAVLFSVALLRFRLED